MKTVQKPLSAKALYLIAFFSLAVGGGYYYLFRSAVVAERWFGFERETLSFADSALLGALPEFVHVFAFSLLTYLVLERRYALFSILFWVTVNLFFELAQLLPKESVFELPYILRIYIQNGTFSVLDIAAIFLGGYLAYKLIK